MKEDLPASGDWWKLSNGETCPTCNGQRLGPVGRNVFLSSVTGKSLSLPQLLELRSVEIIEFLKNLSVEKGKEAVLDAILPEVFERLQFMEDVGLDYIALNRETASLSGGESQRIRLASQLGSNLSGVLYILDEPSIGLHPSDNQKLINSLRRLQLKGNSLLVVEHDWETINQADFIIEIGPMAGESGGRLVKASSSLQLTRQSYKKNLSHPLRGKWRNLPPYNQSQSAISAISFKK